MRILNLYSGLGGNRKLWGDEHTVVAVESDPKIASVYMDLYPNDRVIIGDAHQFLLDNYEDFDFIWSSPPCQSHTRMIRSGKNREPRYSDMRLYEEILLLMHNYKGRFVVENVKPYYEPFLNPIEMGRHLIWSNFKISEFEEKNIPGFIMKCNTEGANQLKEWLGINYKGNIYYGKNHDPAQVLRNCVHPNVGLSILNDAILGESEQ